MTACLLFSIPDAAVKTHLSLHFTPTALSFIGSPYCLWDLPDKTDNLPNFLSSFQVYKWDFKIHKTIKMAENHRISDYARTEGILSDNV